MKKLNRQQTYEKSVVIRRSATFKMKASYRNRDKMQKQIAFQKVNLCRI